MGYSSRYHAASLAAVFLALAIGILIGVGLGGKVYKRARNDLEQSLKSDLAGSRTRADDLQGQLNQERDTLAQVYPALVETCCAANGSRWWRSARCPTR